MIIEEQINLHCGIKHKSPWNELINLTNFDSEWIFLSVCPSSNELFELDISIGHPGSEQIIIPNIAFSRALIDGVTERAIIIRKPIPRGVRVAIRGRTNGEYHLINVHFILIGNK